MAKTIKLLKAGVGLVRVNSVLNRELSSSCSLSMTGESNVQWEMFRNYSETKNKEVEEKKDELKKSKDQVDALQRELDDAQKKLHKALYAEVIRTWIKDVEREYYDGRDKKVSELQQEIEKMEKEITKQKWMHMLKKDSKSGDLAMISENLAEADDISIEQFAENIADVKSIITQKIHTATFDSTNTLPEEYELLDERRFKRTLYVLYGKNHKIN